MTITQGATTRFSTLGPISVTRDGEDVGLGGEKQRAVLGILLARAGAAVDRDVLIEGLWGPDASDSNVASLHTWIPSPADSPSDVGRALLCHAACREVRGDTHMCVEAGRTCHHALP